MADKIVIEVPDHIDDDDIGRYLEDNYEDYRAAFDWEVGDYDARITVDDISFTSIDLDDDEVTICYELEYSFYSGCKDMDGSDVSDERCVTGTRIGRVFTFEKHVYPERPTTFEEF